MTTLREQEGYFMMDHRESPGIPDEVVVQAELPVGSGKGLFEAPTYTCKHCHAVVVMNPKRNRERAFCRGCNHLLCDGCGIERAFTGECRTMDQKIDDMLKKVALATGD
jgi:hypothetical protein